MRRRPPSEVDPDRLRQLLASSRPRREPTGPSGWVPAEAPPAPVPPAGFDATSLGATGPPADGDPGGRERDPEGRPDRGHGGRGHRGLGGGPDDGPGGNREDDLSDGLDNGDDTGPDGLPGGRHRPPPRVFTVPVAFRGARVAVSVRAVVAFVLVLVVAVVFFAVRVARAQQAAAPQPVPAGEGVVGRGSGSAAFGPSSTSGSTGSGGSSVGAASTVTTAPSARGSPEQLVVDVVGQVARPGVVTVPGGSRVVDVLMAAGGPLATADVQRLNLARLVSDGEQLFVPRPGETPPALLGAVGGAGSGSGVGSGAGGVPGGGAAGAATTGPIDLNTATLAALDSLPGVGPVLAQRILDWRTQHGRFSSVDELGEVSGIGDKLLEQIRPKVRV